MPSIRKTFKNMMDAIAKDPTPPVVPNIEAPEPNYDELYSEIVKLSFKMDQLRNVLDVYHNSLKEEVRKRKEVEAQMQRFKELYEYYCFLAGKLKNIPEQRMARTRADGGEEGESSTSNQVIELDAMCGHCQTKIANIVWLPCRHLCVCMDCDDKVMACLLCDARKVTSLKVDWNVSTFS
ncbi:zinc finger, RING/FYVE/PHD-type [Artemisia annua]|uniref:Zinc finger, RING/FYVE/PHD-type n=1 Tax=Artemisia annua TaxID=35608 RepID=A0A2U1NTC0_ARTAN|nr:zinc finger, RING/FYVE/PHD-type [Artemisia annua]